MEAEWGSLHEQNAVHVVPVGDLISHEPQDCVCGPEHELVHLSPWPDAWVVVHHSLDGREANE